MDNNTTIIMKETITKAPNSLTQDMKLLNCIQKRLVRISTATPAILTAAFHNFSVVSPRLSVFVGPCHYGMALPQVADGGTAFDMEGSCE